MNAIVNFFGCTPAKIPTDQNAGSLTDMVQSATVMVQSAAMDNIADDSVDLGSLGSSISSIGSIDSQSSLYSSDSLSEATKTLDAFAQKVLKISVDGEKLQTTFDYLSQHPVPLGQEVTYKRENDKGTGIKELPHTIKVLKDGTVAVHLRQSVGKGNCKTAKLACVLHQGEVKPSIKLTSKFNNDPTGTFRAIAKAEADSLRCFAGRSNSRIIQLFGEIVRTDKPKTVMYEELGTDGELADRLKKGDLTPEEKCQIVKDIIEGLVEMDKAGIVHRDIKPENIILTMEKGKLRAKIIDFGFGRDAKLPWTPSGSPKYVAFELWEACNWLGVDTSRIRNNKIDAFATGLTLRNLIPNAQEPTRDPVGYNQAQVTADWKNLVREMVQVRSVSQSPDQQLVAGLLNIDQDQRLSPALANALANQLTPQHFGAVA